MKNKDYQMLKVLRNMEQNLVVEDVQRTGGELSPRTIDERIDLVIAARYNANTVRSSGCLTTFYRHPDSDYLYVVTSNRKRERRDLMIDTTTYRVFGGGGICWSSRRDENDIAFYKFKRVHRLLVNAKVGMDADHMYTNVYIISKDSIRECQEYQNQFNSELKIKEIMHRRDKSCYFTDRACCPDSVLVKDFEAKGYTFASGGFNKHNIPIYEVASPDFDTEEEWYAAINEYENAMYGEFRYNPVQNLSNSFDLFFDCVILQIISERRMWEIRLQSFLFTGRYIVKNKKEIDLKKYFNLQSQDRPVMVNAQFH